MLYMVVSVGLMGAGDDRCVPSSGCQPGHPERAHVNHGHVNHGHVSHAHVNHGARQSWRTSIMATSVMPTSILATSILAAANPIGGGYDRSKSLRQNIQISAPIMSRFDLFFVLVDDCNEDGLRDRPPHPRRSTGDGIERKYSIDDIQRYIMFARCFNPVHSAIAYSGISYSGSFSMCVHSSICSTDLVVVVGPSSVRSLLVAVFSPFAFFYPLFSQSSSFLCRALLIASSNSPPIRSSAGPVSQWSSSHWLPVSTRRVFVCFPSVVRPAPARLQAAPFVRADVGPISPLLQSFSASSVPACLFGSLPGRSCQSLSPLPPSSRPVKFLPALCSARCRRFSRECPASSVPPPFVRVVAARPLPPLSQTHDSELQDSWLSFDIVRSSLSLDTVTRVSFFAGCRLPRYRSLFSFVSAVPRETVRRISGVFWFVQWI